MLAGVRLGMGLRMCYDFVLFGLFVIVLHVSFFCFLFFFYLVLFAFI